MTVQGTMELPQPDELFRNQGATIAKSLHNARGSVERVFCPHRLRLASDKKGLKFNHRSAGISSLTFNLIRYGTDIEVDVSHTERSQYIMVIPLAGRAEVKHGHVLNNINRGSYIILDPRQPFKFVMDQEHVHLAVGVPRAALGGLAETDETAALSSQLSFSHNERPIKPEDQSLFDFLSYLCREVDRPHSSLGIPGVPAALEQTFLRLLISSATDGKPMTEHLHSHGIAPKSVRLAENYMTKNIKEEICVEDVARAAGVSPRALSYSFKLFRDTSPMKWLKRQRLYRAHADLIAADGPASVTEVSLRYCSSNPGRFAKSYYQEFGEYPSATLRRSPT